MFFVKLSKPLVVIVLAAVFLAHGGCETSNSNIQSCFEDDCEASCKTKGFESGVCAGEICECQDGNNASYQWREDTGSNEDTDSDAGSP